MTTGSHFTVAIVRQKKGRNGRATKKFTSAAEKRPLSTAQISSNIAQFDSLDLSKLESLDVLLNGPKYVKYNDA